VKRREHKFIDGIEYKYCPLCETWKVLDDYQHNRTKLDGFQSLCKKCKGEINARYRRENIDKVRASDKRYREDNHERVLLSNKLYCDRNREEINTKHREYHATPRGKATSVRSKHRRRAREKEIVCTLTGKEWEEILQIQINFCKGCGVEFDEVNIPHADHIYPVVLGGSTTKENIQALCRTCNCSKADKIDWTYPYVREWT